MKYSKATTLISLITFIVSIIYISLNGLNLSIEFTGGTVAKLHYNVQPDMVKIRQLMMNSEATVQASSNDLLIKTNQRITPQQLIDTLSYNQNTPQIMSIEFVGPEISQQLSNSGILAVLLVCIGIMIYLATRFEWRFAIAAIVANLHDVIIVLGCFAALKWEFSPTVLAAILAVFGYSVNESVIVFDRIRENCKLMQNADLVSIINQSITSVISRTIITHGCTEMMAIAMLLFGGITLHGFAIALALGILFSIYSSVLVAAPILTMLKVQVKHFNQVKSHKQEIVV